jgi:hypothetical protein
MEKKFKYLSEKEIRSLGLFGFITYCKGVNEEIGKHKVGDGACEGLDQYLMLKGIEDKFILMALRMVNIENNVVGFRVDFEVEVEDNNCNPEIRNIGVIRMSNYTGYVIKDIDGNVVPFSYISPLGVVLKELMDKISTYIKARQSVIYDDAD